MLKAAAERSSAELECGRRVSELERVTSIDKERTSVGKGNSTESRVCKINVNFCWQFRDGIPGIRCRT
jgi:hypothetical protein